VASLERASLFRATVLRFLLRQGVDSSSEPTSPPLPAGLLTFGAWASTRPTTGGALDSTIRPVAEIECSVGVTVDQLAGLGTDQEFGELGRRFESPSAAVMYLARRIEAVSDGERGPGPICLIRQEWPDPAQCCIGDRATGTYVRTPEGTRSSGASNPFGHPPDRGRFASGSYDGKRNLKFGRSPPPPPTNWGRSARVGTHEPQRFDAQLGFA
jgi:hypothetical protein